MPDIDAEKIAELRSLLAKATPGPWSTHLVDDTTIMSPARQAATTCDSSQTNREDVYDIEYEQMEADAALIVAMRNAMPAMLDLASKSLAPASGEDGELLRVVDETLQAMASLASVPMDLWDRHSNAVLELIALARSLSSRVEEVERENETQVIESIAVRDKFIIERDLWLEFVNQLPDKRPSLDSTVAAAIEAAALTAERRAKEEAGLDRRAEELREDARLGAALARAEAAETRSAELARALDEAKTGLTLAANDFRDMALAAHETAQAFLAKIGTIKFSTARDDLLRELAQVQRPADADDRPCDDTWEDANLLWDFADRARATLEAPNA